MMNNQWILVLFSSPDKFADVWPFGMIVDTQLDARIWPETGRALRHQRHCGSLDTCV